MVLRYHDQLVVNDVLSTLEDSPKGWLAVVDASGHYLGTLTDGDVRRGILNQMEHIKDWINRSSPVARPGDDISHLLASVQKRYGKYLPVLDEQGKLLDLLAVKEPLRRTRPNKVVLMVGGLGRRLGELTQAMPKPMLPLGHKPILHYILDSFVEYGFHEFYFCVNYRAEMIREYFGDGTAFGVNIHYIEEEKPLGTAGGLGLIEAPFKEPFLVMNGDILTTLNLDSLLQFHLEKEAIATMCTHEHNHRLPYGVVSMRQSRVLAIHEKPYHTYYINAGIYVLSEAARAYIPRGQYMDMTTVFEQLMEIDAPVHAYIINEFWMDIGQREDYVTSQKLFNWG